MRASLIALAVLGAQGIMTVAMLRVGSAYEAGGGATLSVPSSSTLDQADLELAARLYQVGP
jgi:hypothetical protein